MSLGILISKDGTDRFENEFERCRLSSEILKFEGSLISRGNRTGLKGRL